MKRKYKNDNANYLLNETQKLWSIKHIVIAPLSGTAQQSQINNNKKKPDMVLNCSAHSMS